MNALHLSSVVLFASLVACSAAAPEAETSASADTAAPVLQAGRYRADRLSSEIDHDFVVVPQTGGGRYANLLEPTMFASTCVGGDVVAVQSCEADGVCWGPGNTIKSQIHVTSETGFDFYADPYNTAPWAPSAHFSLTSADPIAACDPPGDVYDAGGCSGPGLTVDEARAFFPPGSSWVGLGTAPLETRYRSCDPNTGCSDWGPSYSASTLEADLESVPGGFSLILGQYLCTNVGTSGTLTCSNPGSSMPLTGTAVMTDHCLEFSVLVSVPGSNDPPYSQAALLIRY